ncbi:MAG: phosphoribosyltransferase [Bdellovibrio sp.]|nr:phosphoribosyltransferase [Bdellovibrio sp.]
MQNDADLFKKLSSVQAVIKDTHVVYTSGKHGSAYINKDAIYPHTGLTSDLCERIAKNFLETKIDVVVAPVLGGIILSQWVTHHLSRLTGNEILALYAEKSEIPGEFLIKRGYDKLLKNRKTLVVEDVLTTGGSVKKVVELVRTLGAEVVGVGALCNRGGITPAELGNVPSLYSVLNISLDSWDEASCPLCKTGVTINENIGKGREYVLKKKGSNLSGAV